METTLSSNINTTLDSSELLADYAVIHLFINIFAIPSVALNLLLNPLMLLVLYHVTTIQQSTKIFLASLTLSDLCIGLHWGLLLTETITKTWLLGDILCEVSGVITFAMRSLCIFSLLLLTVDRYIAISHPLRYSTLMTAFRSKIIVCATWVTNIILYTLLYGTYNQRIVVEIVDLRLCVWVEYDWRICITISTAVAVLATIFILYIRISLIARRHARRIATDNQAGIGQGGQRIPQQVNTRSTTTIVIITGTLIITWIPSTILLVIVLGNSISEISDYDVVYQAHILTEILFTANSWLNVVIYYLRNRDLRQTLHSLLSACHHRLLRRCLPYQ